MIIVLQAIGLIACAYVLFLASSIPTVVSIVISCLFVVAAVIGLKASNPGFFSECHFLLSGQIKAYWIVLGISLALEIIGIVVVVGLYFAGYPAWTVRTTDRTLITAHNWYVVSGVLTWSMMRKYFRHCDLTS